MATEDIKGISKREITHKLNVYPYFSHVKQKRKKFVADMHKAVNDDVDVFSRQAKSEKLVIPIVWPI